MTDDLSKRLIRWPVTPCQNDLWDADDRIKELEAKLAKTVKFLEFLDENYRHVFGDTARAKFAQLHAELKGQNDD